MGDSRVGLAKKGVDLRFRPPTLSPDACELACRATILTGQG
jgi:hypothetical protein